MVILIDLMDGKVSAVDGGFEVGFEGRVDLAQFLPDDALKERVGFDLDGAVFTANCAEAVLHVAEESAMVLDLV